jgi:ABC-2 type transport system ATP-binding protein
MTVMTAFDSPLGGIELHGLTRSFGAVHAVRGIDLSIAPGETVALLGPNGAGKSTTIDVLLGLLPPDRGTVSVFGLTPRQAIDAGDVGAMLQAGGLVRDLTVRELVTMMAALSPHPLDVDDVLGVTGTTRIARRRVQKLSGGEIQRVRFAIALVSDPRLLVLDEPTVGMDVEARHDFWTVMRAFSAGGKTVIFATHYLEEADAYADRVVLMANGRVVADGAATEIKARVGLRTIRAMLPNASLDDLSLLPGVRSAERRGEAVLLTCDDSDAAVRAVLQAYPAATGIEVRGAGLEEAFFELTATDDGEVDAEASR